MPLFVKKLNFGEYIHVIRNMPRLGDAYCYPRMETLYIYWTRKRSRVGIKRSYFSTEHNVQAQAVYHMCQSIVCHARANM